MITEWRPIPEFSNYSVSDTGFVRNNDNGREMTRLVNQSGTVHVGLTRNRVLHKRSLPRLVSEAFLVPPRHITFDTPINLDGDRYNNRVENLLWRPRWFATKYFWQFKDAPATPDLPVKELNTGEQFETSWDAAVAYGLLDRDIRLAVRNHTEVWPTWQRFRALN